MAAWKLTIRNGPKVERSRHASAREALDALAGRLGELGPEARRTELHFMRRSFDPSRQVAVRAELAGPGGVRGGLDLRGDGSSEAYTGRLRRQLIERRGKESSLKALRRVLLEAQNKS